MADALSRSGASSAEGPGVARLDSILVSEEHLEELLGSVNRTLGSHHVDHPLERGMSKEELRAVTGLGPSSFEALLAAAPEVIADGASVRLEQHQTTLAPEQQLLRDQIVARVRSAGASPPTTGELAADPALLRALVEAGDLVRIGDFFLTGDQARHLRADVRNAIQASGPLTVAQIRDLLGTSRKYAVPLCEWLDSTRATRRQGDLRYLGPRP